MNNSPNLIKIIGLKNDTLDFSNILLKSHSLIIKNCFNVKFIIKSKINKIIVEKSNNLLFIVNKLICGIEVAYSKSILISSKNDSIPILDMFKSIIYLFGNLKEYSNVKIISEQSELINLDPNI